MSQLFPSGGQSIGSASALVLLKSKDITLPTKVHLVKAMVFPVVMYGYESWTIKKAESQRTDAFKLWGWRRLLRVPWTARRSKHSILRETNREYSLEGLMLKLQYSGHLMWRADSLEKTPMLGKIKGRRRRGQQRRRWLDGITNSMAKLLEIMKNSEALHAAVHRVAKNQIQLRDWTTTRKTKYKWASEQCYSFSVLCFMKERTETCWEFPGCPVVKTSPSYTVGS